MTLVNNHLKSAMFLQKPGSGTTNQIVHIFSGYCMIPDTPGKGGERQGVFGSVAVSNHNTIYQ